jgi:hypothetical protein
MRIKHVFVRLACGVTLQRAAISPASKPRSSASFLNASNWSAGCMFSRVTFSSRLIVGRVDDAVDRLGLFDLLPLHPQKLSKPPALADGHEIASRWSLFPIQLQFDDKAL